MKNKTKYSPAIGLTILLSVIGQTVFISAAGASPVEQNQTFNGFAESGAGAERKQITRVETQGLDTVLDIPLRLGGFVTTVVGTGLFIATSPFTGLMTALYPHDAIQKAADFLIVRPGNYTFVRPSGRFNYDSRSDEEK